MEVEVLIGMELASPRANVRARAVKRLDLVLLGNSDPFNLITNIVIFFDYRFGVCCIFVTSTSGSTITQNCTYIQNPGYPSAYGGTSSVSYTIQKCSSGLFTILSLQLWNSAFDDFFSEVCWLRLDFEAFTIQGTGATTEVNGGACLDSFTVTVTFLSSLIRAWNWHWPILSDKHWPVHSYYLWSKHRAA